MRIALLLEYDGSAYHGWQLQAGVPSVQEDLEQALGSVAGAPVRATAAGRTDRGVHASVQVVHFDAPAERPLSAWVRGVNAHLGAACCVRWAGAVDDQFHARFDAKSRSYCYLLHNHRVRPAMLRAYSGWCHRPLDVELMQRAAGKLLGEHDFTSFRASQCQAKTPIKTMHSCDVSRHGEWIMFRLRANAFLHHMVRNIVGALVRVGRGAAAPEWMDDLLAARNRSLGAPTFGPQGLYLCGIEYPPQCGLPAEQLVRLPFPPL
ncbi:MAG: tRNA pseudouridine(38-40) synthase TruA [Rhodocyclaceae bacterium]|nr:tRNA pseudouridine(38-40) synthase TruA [Rhodocyclaceae bacterium]MBX3666920.1 tRNA pseudouridine(38-40) synthase TruA [Rhodocyclaceae bacterium]